MVYANIYAETLDLKIREADHGHSQIMLNNFTVSVWDS